VERPARRVLHVCYCCDDREAATRLFVEHLGMLDFMGTAAEPSDGSILGIERDVVAPTRFVYDARGPRTSPAIEVQEWIDPPLLGTPVDDPTRGGIQALGVAVPAVADTTERLLAAGCVVRGGGTSPFDGRPWTTLRDPAGVTLDLVEDATLPAGGSRLHHLRVTCTDLAVSRRWYEGVGFDAVGPATAITDASFLDGALTAVEADALRLRLPDEPFEVLLSAWHAPPAHGRHVEEANHAGLYRAALGVDDTRASYAEMLAAGWAFDQPPTSIVMRGTPVPEMWICFLRDPDGVPFELVQRPRDAFR